MEVEMCRNQSAIFFNAPLFPLWQVNEVNFWQLEIWIVTSSWWRKHSSSRERKVQWKQFERFITLKGQVSCDKSLWLSRSVWGEVFQRPSSGRAFTSLSSKTMETNNLCRFFMKYRINVTSWCFRSVWWLDLSWKKTAAAQKVSGLIFHLEFTWWSSFCWGNVKDLVIDPKWKTKTGVLWIIMHFLMQTRAEGSGSSHWSADEENVSVFLFRFKRTSIKKQLKATFTFLREQNENLVSQFNWNKIQLNHFFLIWSHQRTNNLRIFWR